MAYDKHKTGSRRYGNVGVGTSAPPEGNVGAGSATPPPPPPPPAPSHEGHSHPVVSDERDKADYGSHSH